MKIAKVLITTLLCVGVVSVADARQRHRKQPPAVVVPPPVHHTITPSLITATPGGLWSYNADLTSGNLVAGDGFTIFDFGGYVAGSVVAPVNWSASTSLTGGSIFGLASLGTDDPSLTNLTFTYTGATVVQTIGATTFTGFNANTTSLVQVIDDWVSRDHGLDGSVSTEHRDQIIVPGGSSVPDGGSTVALLGVALGALEATRRIVRARKA
jgi:hypothetical protein